ncbi:MAG TPA: NADH-quinone oxidoreductase subunit C [Candidatus Deferrimicrobiaceae bacterium]
MDPKAIFEALKGRFGDAVRELQEQAVRPPTVVVDPAKILEIARYLRDDPAMRFDSLMCLSGVDRKESLSVVYHLFSMTARHAIGVRADVPRETPELPSVDSVWPAANFMEREVFDLFGIVFAGSHDLRRILLPDDWEGHPLRKDYKYPDAWHGIKL